MDLVKGTLANPQTLAQYTYMLNDPLYWVDLNGLDPRKPSHEADGGGCSDFYIGRYLVRIRAQALVNPVVVRDEYIQTLEESSLPMTPKDVLITGVTLGMKFALSDGPQPGAMDIAGGAINPEKQDRYMISNEQKIKSFRASLSADGSMILNIATKVSLLKTQGAEVTKISDYRVVKHPSYGAFSLDSKKIAYKNTAGIVAAHDIKAEQLLLKHKAVEDEGYGLHFIQQDRRILSSTWDCDIYMIDIDSGGLYKTKIGEGEYIGGALISGLEENEFFILCTLKAKGYARIEYSHLYKLMVKENEFDFFRISTFPVCNTLTPVRMQNRLLFSSDSNVCNKIYSYDMLSDTFDEFIDIREMYMSGGGEKKRKITSSIVYFGIY